MNASDRSPATSPPPFVRFDRDFSRARLEDGRIVTFSALEARTLSFMSRNPGRILTRENFLDALGDADGRRSERSIDFLINRLRKKLEDNVQTPHFISTRYGVGYVWLANGSARPDLSDAFCVIYALRGVEAPDAATGAARAFGHALRRTLQRRVGDDRRVVWAPDLEDLPNFVPGPDLSIEIACFRDGQEAEILVRARAERSGAIVHASRHPAAGAGEDFAAMIDRTAGEILLTEWAEKTVRAEAEVPLPMVAHTAVGMPYNGPEAWPVAEAHLRELRRLHPDDPRLKLIHASHLQAKYVQRGHLLFLRGEATCGADQAEIERLVLDALDYAQTRPDYAISAAKLLYFADPHYRDVAEEMAERALKDNDRPATSLAMVGQLRAFLGRLDAAVALLEQAVALSPRGSEYRAYTLVVLCQALIAARDWDRLAQVAGQLHRLVPATFFVLEPFFTNPDRPSLRARATVLALSKPRARAFLQSINYTCARLFQDPARGASILRAPATLFQRRFGPEVLPEEVRVAFPSLTR